MEPGVIAEETRSEIARRERMDIERNLDVIRYGTWCCDIAGVRLNSHNEIDTFLRNNWK